MEPIATKLLIVQFGFDCETIAGFVHEFWGQYPAHCKSDKVLKLFETKPTTS